MASYELRFKRSVKKDLRRIANQDIPFILNRIEALAVEPRPPGCKKLSSKELYRVRQGVYRILYEIFDDKLVILVVAVAKRALVYRK
ncbi:MAG TPA: type II toxin-antitoxin system mRNA interferase toxin, RelE/StbE family [Gammaproteobacteria bacterium]|mgnify:FL=1|jgi:mRNA interferase RelE/StbE|nr:type II toxin-antitoxin system RelE/ParE family toxin [Gammaproteobacteria bacterium]HAJ76627.1 type II toxin-antitoxin system mRNA interferase toxin, RelE/StbE family [Gammaproteobacteria bacterium]|tara:strand:+ start:4252 stop:4512 length:261 start_codon:yes stop_codon:yes gene_type:complete